MKRMMLAALALSLLLTGCGARLKPEPAAAQTPTEETLAVVTEAATTAPRPIAERAASLQAAGDSYIFDEQNVLTDEEKKQYNNYLGWLCTSRQIKAAAVITDSLGGISAPEFARSYFETLFGGDASGFLLLVNNDTNEDQIYRAGTFASQSADPARYIAKATPALVEQRYADALELLLPVGETVSDRIFDQCNALTAEQRQTLAALANTSEELQCVLIAGTEQTQPATETAETESVETDAPETEASETSETENSSETTEDTTEAVSQTETAAPEASDELKAEADRIRTETGAAVLLLIDADHKAAYISGSSNALDSVQNALDSDGIYAAATAFFGGQTAE